MQLFRRAKSEVSCFVSSYPEFYLLIFSKIAAVGWAMEEADVHGMGACAGIAPQQPGWVTFCGFEQHLCTYSVI